MSATTTTNGASLEDCLTNIYSLIDLDGLKWKRFKLKESNSANSNSFIHHSNPTSSLTSSSSNTPIDTHPILTTYAKCLEENHIAAWRYKPQKRHGSNGSNNTQSSSNNHNPGPGGGGTGSMNSSNFPTPTRNSNNNTPTSAGPTNNNNSSNNNLNSNNSNNNYNQNSNLELWIFGYGHQLKVDNVIGEDLVEIEDDDWESKGLSYECRTLLFKALHNLIERSLINKGFTKLGRWFVQLTKSTNINNSNPLHHNQDLTNNLFDQIQNLQHTSRTTNPNISVSSNNHNNTSVTNHQHSLSTKLSLSFSFSFFVHGDSTVCTSVDVRHHPVVHALTKQDLTTFQNGGIVRVLLAPYGLNGILYGVSYKDNDNAVATSTFIRQWSKFFPIPETMARLFPGNGPSGAIPKSSSATITQPVTTSNIIDNSSNTFNNKTDDNQPIRSYLSNLTNMLSSPQANKAPNLNINSTYDQSNNEIPPILEVIVAGQRMRYPTECVFTVSKFIDPYKNNDQFDFCRPVECPPRGAALTSMVGSESRCAPPENSYRAFSQKCNDKLKNNSLVDTKFMKLDSNIKLDQPPTPSSMSRPFNKSSSNMIQLTPSPLKDQTNRNEFNHSTSKTSSGTTLLYNNVTNNNNNINNNNSYTTSTPSTDYAISKNSNTLETSSSKFSLPHQILFDNLVELSSKNDQIDVYRPVECFVMQPPPKWAALTNTVGSESRCLPPECIYKASSQRTNDRLKNNSILDSKITKLDSSNKSEQPTTPNPINRSFNKSISNMIQPTPSPLKDQTNRNEFNHSPTKTSSGTTLLYNNITNNNNNNNNNNNINNSYTSSTPSAGIAISKNPNTLGTSTSFSPFSLPHQILFNNLVELSSIQLNLMLSDSIISMILDHNFESCTLCVCNMSIKGSHYDVIPQKSELVNRWKSPITNINNNLNTNNNTIDNNANDYVNECTCAFSATTTRHCSHLAGLFYEDELELTNLLYDPTEMIDKYKLFRKIRLSSYNETCYSEEKKLIAKLFPASLQTQKDEQGTKSQTSSSSTSLMKGGDVTNKNGSSSMTVNNITDEETKIFVIDQLKQLCSTSICSNSSLTKIYLSEALRNNRHLSSCTNYSTQIQGRMTSASSLHSFLDENSAYTTIKNLHRNPISLKYTDLCEITKGIINTIAPNLFSNNHQPSRSNNPIVKPLGPNSMQGSGIAAMFSRMIGASRSPILGKASDIGSRNNIFIQGLQPLILPTLTIDPKGALQMLEHLLKEESKEALATLNKAILIFASSLHDWQFLTTPVPANNHDVVTLLKSVQPLLFDAVGHPNRLWKDFQHQQQQQQFSGFDSPPAELKVPTPPCQGPLTWRQFHHAAGSRTEDQVEPQPIPSLLVGHQVEKNHLAISPFALKFWDELLLEPYAPGHNMYYLVIAPDFGNVSYVNNYRSFFKELSNMYELMKLGKHTPIGSFEGIIQAEPIKPSSSSATKEPSSLINTANTNEDSTSTSTTNIPTNPSSSSSNNINNINNPKSNNDKNGANAQFDEAMFAKLNPMEKNVCKNIINQLNNYSNKLNEKLVKTLVDFLNEREPPFDPHEDRFESSASTQTSHCLVIYMIDPFTSPSLNSNLRIPAIIGLMRCYQTLMEKLPESLRSMSQLQLISLDSIIGHSRALTNMTRYDQLKSLSMNVFARCRRLLTNQITAKSLTGFGPAAALENFFKTKKPDMCISRVFTPPFILATTKDKQTELGEMFGEQREKSVVLFCSYCLTEDQRWLLASLTNDRGEMSETAVININIVDRIKRPKASVKRIALRKLMEFIISVMSEWVNPWRLIIGKMGRLGHGELREWADLLSKKSLLNYSKQLVAKCGQCSMLPTMETVGILSACLVSLEPDSKLRVMPDQFTSDDRQASFNKCPLSTPEDASATHILVFPLSANIQSTQGNAEDNMLVGGEDDDLIHDLGLDGPNDLDMSGVENPFGLDDEIFSVWPGDCPTDDLGSGHPGDAILSSSNLPAGREDAQLLNQPLALGYYVSTAKLGPMPNWFWSGNAHLRNLCPVFLKSALHIHKGCVQLSDDDIHSAGVGFGVGGHANKNKSHQLDSTLTTDVLRYVLEGYNSLSWLVLNPGSYDRQSCLPVHMQNLLQLYHMMESFS